MSNSNKVVLITGASSGFGAAIAKALATQGYHVFGTARSPRAAPSDGYTTLALDVTRDDSVRACIGEVIRAAGRMDAVINNAGIGIAGAIEDTTSEDAQAQFDPISSACTASAGRPCLTCARSARVRSST